MVSYNEPYQIEGLHVKYYDFLGQERYGNVVAVEPNPINPDIPYLYIKDEDFESMEIHSDYIPYKGTTVEYNEIRTSDQVFPDL